MQAELTKPFLSVVRQGGRLSLHSTYSDALKEFIAQLPNARWDRAALRWTCDLTPATCWRIVFHAPAKVEADEEVSEIARAFFKTVMEPTNFDRQPIIRHGDDWRHQRGAFSFAMQRESALLAMGMGTGKSRCVVNVAQNSRAKRVLILCPVSVRGVWRREFEKHAVATWNVMTLDSGTVANKTAAAKKFLSMSEGQGKPVVIVVNYETARVEAFLKWATSIDWDLVVCDESHRIKSPNGQSSKAAAEIGMKARRRLALSGTPMAHSPLDLFGQFRFLDRGIFGTSYHRFRNEFAVSGPFGMDHIVGFKNQDELARRMALITYEVGREVLDLPDAQHIYLPVKLETETRRVYEEMSEDLIAFLDSGEEITAPNGLVKLLRLQQITGGFIKPDDGPEQVIGNEKRAALSDILEDAGEPVVVCCRFRSDLDNIKSVAESHGLRYGEISGREKTALNDHSMMREDIDVAGVQIQSGGVGIDLTRARIAVCYSVGFSLGDYDQWLARVHRPGQSRPVVYYHLVAENTVDQAVYGALQKKRDVIEAVITYLKGENF